MLDGLLDVEALFDTVERSAFRLEPLPRTGPPVDARDLAQDLAQDLVLHLPWFDAVRRAVDAGRVVQRVRIVDRPPTPYQRFELSLAPFQAEAGEEVRFLSAPVARDLSLPPLDFWLLDDRRVVTLDDLGAQVISEPAVVLRMRRYRDVAWRHAVPFDRVAD
jgi:hypothetical protein